MHMIQCMMSLWGPAEFSSCLKPLQQGQVHPGLDESVIVCSRLKPPYSRLRCDDTSFAQNELERNRITRAHTNVSNLSSSSDP